MNRCAHLRGSVDTPQVHGAMMGDWMNNLEEGIPHVLAAGVRVLIYAGDKDYICNWRGNQRWVCTYRTQSPLDQSPTCRPPRWAFSRAALP